MKYNIAFLLRTAHSTREKIIAQLMEAAASVRSIVRPNRKFGRYRKNTRRRYYIHMKNGVVVHRETKKYHNKE
jgi:hypothetical protein